MKRKIYNKLLEWKEKGAGKTALLIDGARRVGKSYIAEQFAKAEYESFVLLISVSLKKRFANFLIYI